MFQNTPCSLWASFDLTVRVWCVVIGYKSQGPCFPKKQGKFNVREQMDAGFLISKACVTVAVIRDLLIVMQCKCEHHKIVSIFACHMLSTRRKYIYFISHYILKYNSTLWRQTCVCNAQGNAQNARHQVNISVVMHGAFKFHFSAHHCGHMFLTIRLVSLFF